MKEVTIERVRQAYPNPQTIRDDAWVSGSYCVGGALLRFATGNEEYEYPDFEEICNFFMAANPRLTSIRAEVFAFQMTVANDEGRFEDAWNFADEALTFLQ